MIGPTNYWIALAPNKPLQRPEVDKVYGRGRGRPAPKQVRRTRALKGYWPPA
jgi:hypothetical protein